MCKKKQYIIDVPFWRFVSDRQTKYLEMTNPQEWGDVKHWDINPKPCMYLPKFSGV